MPYLSIIVPVYNAEKYINECIKSILNQTYRDFELILADDGSYDKGGEICDKFAKENRNVTVIHTKKEGVVSARKTAFNKASGEYVGFVDADDFIMPDMFDVLCAKTQKYNCDIAACGTYTGCDILHKTVMRDDIRNGFYTKRNLKDEIYPNALFNKNTGTFGITPVLWNKIFKRGLISEFINNVNPHIITGEDAAVSLAALFKANTFYYTAEPKYFYRQTPNSLTKKYTRNYFMSLNALIHTIYDFFGDCVTNDQINMYIAKMAVYGVRGAIELTGGTFIEKYRNLKLDYMKYNEISDAVKGANAKYFGSDIKPWLKLLKKDKIFMCALLSHIKRGVIN